MPAPGPGLDLSQRCTTGKWGDELFGCKQNMVERYDCARGTLVCFPYAFRGASEFLKRLREVKTLAEEFLGKLLQIPPLT